MENEQVTITLTVQAWQGILNVLGGAPHFAVNSILPAVNDLQAQAGEQIAELQKKYPAPEQPPQQAAE